MIRRAAVRPVSRRRFLAAALAAGAGPALLGASARRRPIAGGFADDGGQQGHLLWQAAPARRPLARHRVDVVIVGAGIAGLAAAWRLERRGLRHFTVLEMEGRPGGNARWGENEITAFPWAAHYLPVPGPEATLVRELCAEFGLLREDGSWDERHLCHAPQERLFLHGRWQEGLEPQALRGARDHDEFLRFHELMARFRATGAFTIPAREGLRRAPAEVLALDRVPFGTWLRGQGFASPYLHWYADYATRDDYGGGAETVSALAGLHYFASRDPHSDVPLTWPEGNGWLARRLLAVVGDRVRSGAFVRAIAVADAGARPAGSAARRVVVTAGDEAWEARAVIFAAPTFLLPRLLEPGPLPDLVRAAAPVSSPWLTANLVVDRPPREPGLEPAWDNVIYGSPALGYVVATHQQLRRYAGPTVFTFYWALANGSPAANRRLLQQRRWEDWRDAILGDLARAHPDLRDGVARLDVLRLGHAMVRPVPGFLTSVARERLLAHGADDGRGEPPLFLANSDLSGLPLFEEAVENGVRAADRALARLA